jgi:MscS family membrane protein
MSLRPLPWRAVLPALLLLAAAPRLAPAQDEPAGAPPAAASTPRREVIEDRLRVMQEEARPFFERHLPAPLREPGPRGLLWWQWLALPLLFAVAVAVGSLLGWVTRSLLGKLTARTRTTYDDLLVDRVGGPLAIFWAIAVVTVLHPWLLLGPTAEGVLERVLRAATYLTFFWAGFRSVDVAFAALGHAPWTQASAGVRGLLPLGRKVGKVVLLAIGAVAVLNELGFQVASLLAGLGIGGIALALAAQKTVENLFGSLAIGVDQPFRVGDFVKIDDWTGTVEAIGMRSTRFRTLDRTLVTFPNGKLADMKSETFAARDRIRLYANLGLSYRTTAAQMRQVLAGIEEALARHPRLAPDAPSVRFTEVKESTLNVEVAAMFATADWNEFTRIRQELLLRFMEIVEQAGTALAYRTRTVLLEGERPGAAPPGAPPANPGT